MSNSHEFKREGKITLNAAGFYFTKSSDTPGNIIVRCARGGREGFLTLPGNAPDADLFCAAYKAIVAEKPL